MSDQRICRCLERNFSCYPSYSKASLVSSSFLSLLHIFQSSTHNFLWENTLMKKWRNSCRKIKLSWHGATVSNIPEGHTCQMHLIMFGFVYNMCMCSYIAIISIWFPCLNNLHVLNVGSFCNLNQYLNLSEKWQKEAIKSYFRVGQIQNLNFSLHPCLHKLLYLLPNLEYSNKKHKGNPNKLATVWVFFHKRQIWFCGELQVPGGIRKHCSYCHGPLYPSSLLLLHTTTDLRALHSAWQVPAQECSRVFFFYKLSKLFSLLPVQLLFKVFSTKVFIFCFQGPRLPLFF